MIRFFFILYSKNCARDAEIDQKRDGINKRCDKRACHNGGVKPQLFGKQGQNTPDQLCGDDRDGKRQADDEGNRQGDRLSQEQIVNQPDLTEGDGGKRKSAAPKALGRSYDREAR